MQTGREYNSDNYMEMSYQITRTSQKYATVILPILLVGCASSMGAQKNVVEDAKPYIQQGNWEKAYRTLEDALGANESFTRLAAYDLIISNPEIKAAAADTFSTKSLSRTFSDFDPFTASELESVRLKWYAKFASDSEIIKAQSNLNVVYAEANRRKSSLTEARRTGLDGLIVDDAIFG